MIDSPPVLAVADASVLANAASGVIFVVGADQTTRNTAKAAVDQLNAAQAHVIGAVLNRVDVEAQPVLLLRVLPQGVQPLLREGAVPDCRLAASPGQAPAATDAYPRSSVCRRALAAPSACSSTPLRRCARGARSGRSRSCAWPRARWPASSPRSGRTFACCRCPRVSPPSASPAVPQQPRWPVSREAPGACSRIRAGCGHISRRGAPTSCTRTASRPTCSPHGPRLVPRALVWHVHDYVSTRRVSSVLLRRHARRAAVVVANSHDVAADVRAVLGARMRVEVVHNGVDTQRFHPIGHTSRFSMPRRACRRRRPARDGSASSPRTPGGRDTRRFFARSRRSPPPASGATSWEDRSTRRAAASSRVTSCRHRGRLGLGGPRGLRALPARRGAGVPRTRCRRACEHETRAVRPVGPRGDGLRPPGDRE